jgi:hypothetical protein
MKHESVEIRRRVYEQIKDLQEDDRMGSPTWLCLLTGFSYGQVANALDWLKRNGFARTIHFGWWVTLPTDDPCWEHGIERIQGICQLCERKARLERRILNNEKISTTAG